MRARLRESARSRLGSEGERHDFNLNPPAERRGHLSFRLVWGFRLARLHWVTTLLITAEGDAFKMLSTIMQPEAFEPLAFIMWLWGYSQFSRGKAAGPSPMLPGMDQGLYKRISVMCDIHLRVWGKAQGHLGQVPEGKYDHGPLI